MNRFLALVISSLSLVAASAAHAATPQAGVKQELRSGLFADVSLGAFFTLGGMDQNSATGPSNPQVYPQLGLGYDISREVSVVLSFGLGASAISCFADKATDCWPEAGTSKDTLQMPENFTATMFMAEGAYKYFFTDRFSLRPHAGVGYALLGPAPAYDGDTPIDTSLLFGGGIGVDYITHMDHFGIGLDASFRYLVAPAIPAVTITPMIRYTF